MGQKTTFLPHRKYIYPTIYINQNQCFIFFIPYPRICLLILEREERRKSEGRSGGEKKRHTHTHTHAHSNVREKR